MRSLQARMFLVFALIATIPLLAMSYLALTATRAALEVEIGRANGDAAQAAAGFVDVYVENARVLLDAESTSPILRDAFERDDRAAMLLSVQGVRDRATYQEALLFRGVAVYSAEGTLLAVWPPSSLDLMMDPLHAAVVDVMRAQREPLVFPAPTDGEPILPLATPILDGPTLRGVLVGDLSLAGLTEGLAPLAAGRQTIFITDARGSLLVHPDAEVLAARPDWSTLPPVREARSPTAPGRNFIEYDDPATGEPSLGSYATIPRLGWVVVDTLPTRVAYGALQNLTGVLVALSGLLVGAILLASVAIARRIVAPVQELTEASRALADGKLGRRLHPQGDDEIAELGRAFDQMADRIVESLEGLRRSETRYRSLVESASDLIFTVQPDGDLSFASPMMKRVLGDAVRTGGPALDLVHPDDRDAFRNAVQRVLEKGEPALWIPFRLVGQSSGAREVLTNFTPIFEGSRTPARVLAVAHDVTEERRQEALREMAFRMAQLVSEETELSSLAARGLRLTLDASGLARGALLLEREGALHPLANVSLPDAAPYLDLAREARERSAPARRARGDEAVLAMPLLEHGEALGAIVLVGDARALDRALDVLAPLASQLAVGIRRSLFEQRLKEHAAELETRVAERTRELTLKSEEMEQFLYSVSHDLKAPLISIQGYAQGLEEDHARVLSNEGALYLERIRSNATLMESLILDILELSRIGRTREAVERVDLRGLFRELEGRFADRFAASGGRLEVDAPLPEVDAEPRRLAQLFSNLLDNAVKYRHPERPPLVRIRAETTPEAIVVHVRDNGRGVPARYHDRLFKIFQRVPTPGMDDPGGTGMGLAIVQRIAQAQGGHVRFESVENEGTTFLVTLPRHRAEAPA